MSANERNSHTTLRNLQRIAAVTTLMMAVTTPSAWAQGAASVRPDRPVGGDSVAMACLEAGLRPLTAQARRSFPRVIARFRAGLPGRDYLAVSAELRDTAGHRESVFVVVDSIQRDTVFGRVASNVALVQGFRRGQAFPVAVAEILDWTIVSANGKEEGNLRGKFIDDFQERLRRSPQRKPC